MIHTIRYYKVWFAEPEISQIRYTDHSPSAQVPKDEVSTQDHRYDSQYRTPGILYLDTLGLHVLNAAASEGPSIALDIHQPQGLTLLMIKILRHPIYTILPYYSQACGIFWYIIINSNLGLLNLSDVNKQGSGTL